MVSFIWLISLLFYDFFFLEASIRMICPAPLCFSPTAAAAVPAAAAGKTAGVAGGTSNLAA